MSPTFVCSTCGETHDGLPTDRAFGLPDDVFAIPKDERRTRAHFDTDRCEFGDRCFIRGVFYVPFIDDASSFGWGVWGEVPRATFDRYGELYEVDGTSEPRHPAILANHLTCYPDADAEPMELQFGISSERPEFFATPASRSSLALEQRIGMTSKRYHQILRDM